MLEEQWGDLQDWRCWQDRNAALIAQDICNRNYGNWPETIEEWRQAATRYDLHLHLVSEMTEPALTHDSTIIIRLTTNPDALARRICHEIAEAVSRLEIGLCAFHFSPLCDEHHAVACRTEQLL